ncbi:hypothetical protein RvY_12956 [Ramazzottius varieornatus]|uniref:Uncharacterized protein n=1 Tax=Ramazzottius varieornatus TaxID=947166 RepID=A0A1D1VL82_RAMVA|nr:hypothetical protein RvY_12956 [Ramazzottius varieornatus]
MARPQISFLGSTKTKDLLARPQRPHQLNLAPKRLSATLNQFVEHAICSRPKRVSQFVQPRKNSSNKHGFRGSGEPRRNRFQQQSNTMTRYGIEGSLQTPTRILISHVTADRDTKGRTGSGSLRHEKFSNKLITKITQSGDDPWATQTNI